MEQGSLKNNYIFNLVYQILTIITPIITTPYISRVLSAGGIGKYSYALSIVTYFGLFGNLGITTYAQLEIAKRRGNSLELKQIIKEIVVARFITMSISIIVYWLVVLQNSENKLLYIILLLYILGQMNDMSFIFQGLENFKTLTMRNIIVKLVSIFLIFMCIHKYEDVYLYAAVIQGTYFLGNFSLWPQIWNYIRPEKMHEFHLIKHWKGSTLYFIPTIATTVYTVLDKTMIGWLTHSEFQNGYYEQAHKIEQLLVTIVTAIGTVTLPRMIYLYKKRDKSKMRHVVEITVKLILFMSIPMVFGLVAVADVLVPCFLGKGYDLCIPLIRIFSLLIIIIGLDNIIGRQCLMSTGKQKLFNIGVISGAILNFCMNIILIPNLGSIGAAVSSVCAELLILVLFIIFSKEYMHIDGLGSVTLKYIVISVLMAAVVWMLGQKLGASLITLFIQIIIGVLIYIGMLFILHDDFFTYVLSGVIKRNMDD